MIPLEETIEEILKSDSPREVLAVAARALGRALQLDSVLFWLEAADRTTPALAPVEWTSAAPDGERDLVLLNLVQRLKGERRTAEAFEAVLASDVSRAPALRNAQPELQRLNISSCAWLYAEEEAISGIIFAAAGADRPPLAEADVQYLSSAVRILLQHLEHCLRFQRAKLSQNIRPLPTVRATETSEEAERYRRLIEHSDAIVFHADVNHVVRFISRRALDFFGLAPEHFVAGERTRWYELVSPEDRERVIQGLQESVRLEQGFDDEFRVINQITGKMRWVLLRLIPERNEENKLIGWDGFGIDISMRREAQEALEIQSRKVRALYTVASAIRGYLDPASIASRGLAALCDATGAEAGVCFLYREDEGRELCFVAQHGFSSEAPERLSAMTGLPNLWSSVAESGHSVVIPDLREEPRAQALLLEEEQLRSAVCVPVTVEDEVYGVIGIFSEKISRFHGGDVMLVSAAANQIGLSARQARLFSAYRKQTKNLAALYRLSHELSQNLSLDEVFQTAFNVLSDELGLQRIWLGLLNEARTRIVGQAAFGPGLKRRLVEVNVEIVGRDHPIARVVRELKPMVLEDTEEVLEAFGLRRVFERLGIHSIALVPLVSAGDVLGVLAVQPSDREQTLSSADLTLLSSLAQEIGSSIRVKRLESQITEGDKMRTAGLLAAGVAHNFNNLLQAVLGQASLLEMQGEKDPRLLRSAKLIQEAATKGARLVRQLSSFAELEEPSREVFDLNDLLERSERSLRDTLRGEQRLRFSFGSQLPKATADSRHVLRILSALVQNAAEAMGEQGQVLIATDVVHVSDESPQLEVPPGEYVRISVRDTGRGMDEETVRRCFEPFFTTRDVDPGTGLGLSGSGLGLAASYALARRNGGRLTVESRLGYGSVFHLYLPVKERIEQVAGKIAEPASLQIERIVETERKEPATSKRKGRKNSLRVEDPK